MRGARSVLRESLSEAFARSADYPAATARRSLEEAKGRRHATSSPPGGAHRLDDPFSQFLAERGGDRVSLESVGALVVAATHVRLAAYLVADVGAGVRRASGL
jgi:hypothetical protein